jgi:hypothetical protein
MSCVQLLQTRLLVHANSPSVRSIADDAVPPIKEDSHDLVSVNFYRRAGSENESTRAISTKDGEHCFDTVLSEMINSFGAGGSVSAIDSITMPAPRPE